MDDRRKYPRLHVLRSGQAVFGGGRSALGCIVLDVSLGGALLQVVEWMTLPNAFELRIKNGATHRAEVCYRGPERTGVRFLEDAA